jgi:hypothetical protein
VWLIANTTTPSPTREELPASIKPAEFSPDDYLRARMEAGPDAPTLWVQRDELFSPYGRGLLSCLKSWTLRNQAV